MLYKYFYVVAAQGASGKQTGQNHRIATIFARFYANAVDGDKANTNLIPNANQ